MQKKFSVGINEDELVSVNGGNGTSNMICTVAFIVGLAVALVGGALSITLCSVGTHKTRNLKKKLPKVQEESDRLRKLLIVKDESTEQAQGTKTNVSA